MRVCVCVGVQVVVLIPSRGEQVVVVCVCVCVCVDGVADRPVDGVPSEFSPHEVAFTWNNPCNEVFVNRVSPPWVHAVSCKFTAKDFYYS